MVLGEIDLQLQLTNDREAECIAFRFLVLSQVENDAHYHTWWNILILRAGVVNTCSTKLVHGKTDKEEKSMGRWPRALPEMLDLSLQN